MASSLDLDIVSFAVPTSGNNPTPLWTVPIFPNGTTYKAIVSAHEVTVFANVNFRHFELLGSYFITFETNKLFVNTEVAAGGTGGSAAWTAAFVNNADLPVLEVTGGGGQDILWKVSIQTIVVRK